jgi:hypothetical protein
MIPSWATRITIGQRNYCKLEQSCKNNSLFGMTTEGSTDSNKILLMLIAKSPLNLNCVYMKHQTTLTWQVRLRRQAVIVT